MQGGSGSAHDEKTNNAASINIILISISPLLNLVAQFEVANTLFKISLFVNNNAIYRVKSYGMQNAEIDIAKFLWKFFGFLGGITRAKLKSQVAYFSKSINGQEK